MPPSKRTEYAWRGYGSIRPHPQGQMQFEGVDPHPDFKELGGHELLTPKQRAIGEKALGATVDQVADRMGAHLDRAFAQAPQQSAQSSEPLGTKTPSLSEVRANRAAGAAPRTSVPPLPDRQSGLTHASGQDWYDPRSSTSEAGEVARIAKQHDVPYHHAAAVKATTARNISPKQENVVTHQVLHQAAQGKMPEEMKGATYDKVVRSAGMHTVEPDAEPLKTPSRYARSHREDPATISPAMGNSYKIPRYYQSYVYPHDERTGPAVDRHMFRAANPDLTNDEVSELQRKGGSKPTKNTFTGLAGASPAPAHRVVHEGIQQAAQARGLTNPEAQTSIWHMVNPQGKDHPAPVNPNQFKMF